MVLNELIDTLWNVNIHCFQTIKIIVCELIDTLWNVNAQMTPEEAKENKRINRYIMECKYRNNMGELLQRTRINRYIMECKLIISSAIRESSTELIDTLWNVN